MLRGIYTAASGMIYQTQAVDVIAHNLANAETNGYKRRELLGSSFGDMLVQILHQAPGTEATVGTGVKVDGIARFETAGNMVSTGNRFNLALGGPGYFLTRGADGVEKLTRDGDFQLDSQNRLVNRAGDLVLNTARRAIVLDGDVANMRISENGTINLGTEVNSQLLVVNPPQSVLESRFPVAPPGLPALANPDIKQGFLEHSNVNVVTEMVSLLTANRAFGYGQKIISAHDQILQKAANDLGRIS